MKWKQTNNSGERNIPSNFIFIFILKPTLFYSKKYTEHDYLAYLVNELQWP